MVSTFPSCLECTVADAACRACYIAVLLYVCGSVLLGATFQKHLSTGALIMGWGIAEFSVMTGTVAVCKSSCHEL